MRRRLDLAASLVAQPSVIFLDEPTTGLDPRSRLAMWDVITGLADSGVTVFLTTQYLEEADRLADRVAVIDGGRVVAEGTPAELKRRSRTSASTSCSPTRTRSRRSRARSTDRVIAADARERRIGVATDGSAAHVRALLDEVDPAAQRGRALLRPQRHARRRLPRPHRPHHRAARPETANA